MTEDKNGAPPTAPPARNVCGIIMPISEIDGCSQEHWADVLEVLSDAIEASGFDPNLVSNADEVGIIHKRIIQNLYDNEMVVCDVSGKNPNVMFELGLRLAFDKPTIIVKDDKTPYSFDTAAIEHLDYPRDLRYSRIVEFKERLAEKITATHKRANADPAYTTFLKHFGEFTVAKLDKKEVPSQQFVIEELKSIRQALASMEVRAPIHRHRDWEEDRLENTILIEGHGLTEKSLAAALDRLHRYKAVVSIDTFRSGDRTVSALIRTRGAGEATNIRIRQEAHRLVSERRRVRVQIKPMSPPDPPPSEESS